MYSLCMAAPGKSKHGGHKHWRSWVHNEDSCKDSTSVEEMLSLAPRGGSMHEVRKCNALSQIEAELMQHSAIVRQLARFVLLPGAPAT